MSLVSFACEVGTTARSISGRSAGAPRMPRAATASATAPQRMAPGLAIASASPARTSRGGQAGDPDAKPNAGVPLPGQLQVGLRICAGNGRHPHRVALDVECPADRAADQPGQAARRADSELAAVLRCPGRVVATDMGVVRAHPLQRGHRLAAGPQPQRDDRASARCAGRQIGQPVARCWRAGLVHPDHGALQCRSVRAWHGIGAVPCWRHGQGGGPGDAGGVQVRDVGAIGRAGGLAGDVDGGHDERSSSRGGHLPGLIGPDW